jgi:hypothetical protein
VQIGREAAAFSLQHRRSHFSGAKERGANTLDV